jgi:hypothetical protein
VQLKAKQAPARGNKPLKVIAREAAGV